ncbi:DNA-3-methyladenine glycosylase I [Furfurilactobacillus curtus]|uniref:DNA-3-methyladenine glycosylase I n=1 Tax=Furfurilactobacillus curtus TaxID=1746200 RepID=A0ABQ5JPT7_9LACO
MAELTDEAATYRAQFGQPVHDEDALFERLTLQVFQAGLNWRMVINKLPIFRQAFKDFVVQQVAAFEEEDVERLLTMPGLIHNERKIRAVINNAQVIMKLRQGGQSFDQYLAQFKETDSATDRPEQTVAATAAAKQLHQQGFEFLGPETTLSFLRSIGLFNHSDHPFTQK